MVAALHPTSPPRRSPEIVQHLSAGRYLAARRYVVGWPHAELVKIGCSSGRRRVRRFTATEGAELIDLAYYDRLYDDVRSEVWLSRCADVLWPTAFRTKDDARKFMGSNTDGWTEFYRVPLTDWPTLRALAAI
jgi:hypothetical protein